MPKDFIPTKDQLKAIRSAASNGEPEACVHMGDFHSNGQDVLPYNKNRALRYYRRAAEAGSAEGQCKAAGLIWELAKKGPDAELAAITEATEYLKKAALQGDASANGMLFTLWSVVNHAISNNLRTGFQYAAHDIDPVRSHALANEIFEFLHGISRNTAGIPAAQPAPKPEA